MSGLPPLAGTTAMADLGWPRRLMPAVFLAGCNLRCHYCINRELVLGPGTSLDAEETLRYFRFAREPWLLVTGGEALCNPGIVPLLSRMKKMGFSVALATNGTRWKLLSEVIRGKLADFVSIDVKTSLSYGRYADLTGQFDKDEFDSIVQTVDGIRQFDVPREFRTTVCSKYVDLEVLREIAGRIGKGEVLSLQVYTFHQTISPELASDKWIVPFETLQEWGAILEKEFGCIAVAREV